MVEIETKHTSAHASDLDSTAKGKRTNRLSFHLTSLATPSGKGLLDSMARSLTPGRRPHPPLSTGQNQGSTLQHTGKSLSVANTQTNIMSRSLVAPTSPAKAISATLPSHSIEAVGVHSWSDNQLAQKYCFEKEIGYGNWGSCWTATVSQSGAASDGGMTVAVKMVHRKNDHASTARVKALWNEYKILRSCGQPLHPSLVHFRDFIITPSYALIAMDYYRQAMNVNLPVTTYGSSSGYFSQLLSCIHWLHERRVTHCDIKVANLLVDTSQGGEHGQPILIDFGFATIHDGKTNFQSKQSWGTPEYLSPERSKAEWHDERKSDVWALGITFFEMATGRTPFEREDEQFLSKSELEIYLQRTLANKWVGEWSIPNELHDLCRCMLQPDPSKRITTGDALQMKFFSRSLQELQNSIHPRSDNYEPDPLLASNSNASRKGEQIVISSKNGGDAQGSCSKLIKQDTDDGALSDTDISDEPDWAPVPVKIDDPGINSRVSSEKVYKKVSHQDAQSQARRKSIDKGRSGESVVKDSEGITAWTREDISPLYAHHFLNRGQLVEESKRHARSSESSRKGNVETLQDCEGDQNRRTSKMGRDQCGLKAMQSIEAVMRMEEEMQDEKDGRQTLVSTPMKSAALLNQSGMKCCQGGSPDRHLRSFAAPDTEDLAARLDEMGALASRLAQMVQESKGKLSQLQESPNARRVQSPTGRRADSLHQAMTRSVAREEAASRSRVSRSSFSATSSAFNARFDGTPSSVVRNKGRTMFSLRRKLSATLTSRRGSEASVIPFPPTSSTTALSRTPSRRFTSTQSSPRDAKKVGSIAEQSATPEEIGRSLRKSRQGMSRTSSVRGRTLSHFLTRSDSRRVPPPVDKSSSGDDNETSTSIASLSPQEHDHSPASLTKSDQSCLSPPKSVGGVHTVNSDAKAGPAYLISSARRTSILNSPTTAGNPKEGAMVSLLSKEHPTSSSKPAHRPLSRLFHTSSITPIYAMHNQTELQGIRSEVHDELHKSAQSTSPSSWKALALPASPRPATSPYQPSEKFPRGNSITRMSDTVTAARAMAGEGVSHQSTMVTVDCSGKRDSDHHMSGQFPSRTSGEPKSAATRVQPRKKVATTHSKQLLNSSKSYKPLTATIGDDPPRKDKKTEQHGSLSLLSPSGSGGGGLWSRFFRNGNDSSNNSKRETHRRSNI